MLVPMPGYWRKLCPQLHVADKRYQAGVTPFRGEGVGDVAAEARERILTNGRPRMNGSAACQPSLNTLAQHAIQTVPT